jgi:hypothetical protein
MALVKHRNRVNDISDPAEILGFLHKETYPYNPGGGLEFKHSFAFETYGSSFTDY